MEFKCRDCNVIFEAEGIKTDYNDPIYGPCSKMVANCPACGTECTEYRKPKPSKGKNDPQDSCPAYHSGSCSCCN